MKRLFAAVGLAAVMLICGCRRKGPGGESSAGQGGGSASSSGLVLYCGAGIRPPAEELIKTFEEQYGVKVGADYAGSETLLSKIKVSQRGDLYMPGDRYYIEQARQAGMIISSRPVCYWVPTILVQKGNPKGVQALEDLLKPGLKVGLGDPNICAIGKISWRILAKNGITREDIAANLKFQSLTVNELGMQIQSGALDAVIVWDAMARYYAKYGDAIPIPPQRNVTSSVDIGVLRFTKDRQTAEKFAEFLSSEQGRAIFEKHNYSTNPP